MPETREDVAERLAIRIHDALASPGHGDDGANADVVGQLGAILYGTDDEDVMALRGEATTSIDVSELPYLIESGLKLLNDPRILKVTADGGNQSEVMIDVVGGTTFTIRSKEIDEDDTDEITEDDLPGPTGRRPSDPDIDPATEAKIKKMLDDVSDRNARSLKIAFLPTADAPTLKSLLGTMVLVSENEGGIFAYGLDENTANAIVAKLNDGEDASHLEEKPFFTLDFDGNAHGRDLLRSIKDGDLLRLTNGETTIGYALHDARATEKLTMTVLD